jgi:hypothetical protein
VVAKQWIGAAPSNAKDIVTVGYLQSQIASLNLPQATVDSLVAAGFTTYADLSYVNAQNALNATKAYVDGTGGVNPNGGDAGRLHLSQVNQPNGVAGLGATSALVDRSRLGLGSTQRFPTPYYSPASYPGAGVTTDMTEVTYDTLAVADPGYTYKILVDGMLDGSSTRDGYCPIVLIRLGSASGPVIAWGYGCMETYSAALPTLIVTPGGYTWPIPTWASVIDILLLGGGGGGSSGVGSPLLWGDGGYAAPWSVTTVVVGSAELPTGTTHITGTIGTGGGPGRSGITSNVGGNGTATTATYHTTTKTSSGGAGGAGIEGFQNGQNAGTATASGVVYQNGGYGCGGRGGSGGIFFGGVGTAGAGGLAIFVPHPPGTDWNSGPIPIVPGSLSDQDPLTGASTLYIQTLRMPGDNTTTGTITVGTFAPSLYALTIPA